MSETSFIRLDRLSKRFGGVAALDQVSFEIRRGEIHAVVGENGAGKSTLMKLLAGVHEPDEGEIRLDARSVRLKNPREARRHGISIVFQELNLFPHRTVAANVFANRELIGRWGGVNRRAMREATQRVLSELEVFLSPDDLVGPLAIGEKQLVEIARTLEQDSQIIILDEPNSALNEAESQRLFEIVRRLRSRGITIVYVSHRLEEVFAIADRITVLRDGRHQGTYATAETTIPRIIGAMIGRPLDKSFPPRPQNFAPGPVVLQVRELWREARLGPISFTARAGEIVGFAGLEGAGVDELFRLLFGLDPMTSGQIIVNLDARACANRDDESERGHPGRSALGSGQRTHFRNPLALGASAAWRAALRFMGSFHGFLSAHWDHEPAAGRAALPRRPDPKNWAARQRSPTRFMGRFMGIAQLRRASSPLDAMRRGWALIPENRREQGLMMDWSITRNATLLVLDKLLSRLGMIDKRAVRSTTDRYIRRLGIVSAGQDQKVTHLSGGNQQKVLLAKWLAAGPAILILNNPTRGVDVGAKWEIYGICHQLAAQGMTILMTSSEAEEVLGLSDRLFVLSKGKVLHEFQRGEVTKAQLMHAMAGAAPLELDGRVEQQWSKPGQK